MNTIFTYPGKLFLLGLIAIFMHACGGGDGSTPTTPPPLTLAEGTLDTTFANGKGFISIPGSILDGNIGTAIVQDSSGNILVTGTSGVSAAIWRFTPDGTLDPKFGKGQGFVTHKISDDSHATSIALDSEGHIILSGYSNKNTLGKDLVIWRFTPEGELDKNFGNNTGYISFDNLAGTNPPTGVDDVGLSLTIDSQGKLLVTGTSRPFAGDADLVVLRLMPDGSRDPEFGIDGLVKYSVQHQLNIGYKISLKKDNKIVVAGLNSVSTGINGLLIVQLNSNGVLDATFGQDGILPYHNDTAMLSVKLDKFEHFYGFDMAIDAENRILIASHTNVKFISGFHMTLWRYTSSGQLDNRFGDGSGMVKIENPFDMNKADVLAMALDANDNILVSGEKYNTETQAVDLAIWRLKPSGEIDTGFARNKGLVTHNTNSDADILNQERGLAMTLTREGKILVTGYSEQFTLPKNLTLWRFK